MLILGFITGVLLSIQAPVISYEISEGSLSEIPNSFLANSENAKLQVQNSYWVKMQLDIPTNGSYILKGGNDYLQNMSFYNDEGNQIAQGNFVELLLQEGVHTIYIFYPFLDQKEENNISINLYEASSFYTAYLLKKTMNATYVGLLLFLFFLSLAFYASVKMTEDIYLKYALYLFCVFYFFAYQFGFLGSIFPIVNSIHPALVWISSASLTGTYVVFFQSFLDLKKKDIVLYKILNYGLGFMVLIVIIESISYFIKYDVQHNVFFTVFSLGFQLVAFISIIYRIYLMKNTLSYIALSAVFILAITSIGAQLASSLRLVEETNYVIMGGLTLEIFILNLGIGYRVLMSNNEKEKAQLKLIDQLKINEKIQEENKVQLEKTVDERTEQLRIKNNHNETLLGEIHHRVKNNLQTITSLLSIQQRKLKDPESIKVIHDSKNRVIAMGLIHEHLYQNTSFDEIDFKRYVKELIDSLITTYSTSEKNIEVSISIPDIKVDLDNGIFLGLIINELVNNSIKHAYDGVEKPFLEILISDSKEQMILVVNDNGKTKDVNYNNPKSFGWKMVNTLCQKLNGILEVDNSDGLSVQICFSPSLAILERKIPSKLYLS